MLQERYHDKECSCFDFPSHSMFTFDVFCGSLGTSIFGNSSSAANNTGSRLPFRFLWLWLKLVVMNSAVILLGLIFLDSPVFFFFLFVKESLFSVIIHISKQNSKTAEQLTLMGMCLHPCYSRDPLHRARVDKSAEIMEIQELVNQLFHQCVISCSHENSTLAQENGVVENKALNDSCFTIILGLLF